MAIPAVQIDGVPAPAAIAGGPWRYSPGSGTYLLISLVLIGGLSLKQANAVKVVLVGGATLISLAVFIVGGEIDWPSAFPLMLGSAVGGRFGAAVALRPSARQWIDRLLILALLLELASMVWMWISPSTQPFMM